MGQTYTKNYYTMKSHSCFSLKYYFSAGPILFHDLGAGDTVCSLCENPSCCTRRMCARLLHECYASIRSLLKDTAHPGPRPIRGGPPCLLPPVSHLFSAPLCVIFQTGTSILAPSHGSVAPVSGARPQDSTCPLGKASGGSRWPLLPRPHIFPSFCQH